MIERDDKGIRLVYVAGPFSAPTAWGVKCNVHAAEQVAARMIESGRAFPVTPHSLGASFDGYGTYEYWLAGTMELLRRCDAVVMVPGWENSSGARKEKELAKSLGMPVFLSVDALHLALVPGGKILC